MTRNMAELKTTQEAPVSTAAELLADLDPTSRNGDVLIDRLRVLAHLTIMYIGYSGQVLTSVGVSRPPWPPPPELLDVLWLLAESESDPAVRSMALALYADLRPDAEWTELLIRDLRTNPNDRVLVHHLERLPCFPGYERFAEEECLRLSAHPNSDVRYWALESLLALARQARLDPGRWESVLRERLTDERESSREIAAYLLGHAGRLLDVQ
jgi:hypothetical protein